MATHQGHWPSLMIGPRKVDPVKTAENWNGSRDWPIVCPCQSLVGVDWVPWTCPDCRHKLFSGLRDDVPEKEKPFVSALLQDDKDEVSRLVYADWLEENGYEYRSQLLRVRIELFGWISYGRSYNVSVTKEAELLRRREDELIAKIISPKLWFRLKKLSSLIRIPNELLEQTIKVSRYLDPAEEFRADVLTQRFLNDLNVPMTCPTGIFTTQKSID